MRKDRLLKALRPLCLDLEPSFPALFLSRMTGDYLSLYTPTEVAEHIHMSSRLTQSTPVIIKFIPLEHDRFKIIVIAYDYFSEFSLFCGLLSSFGLDILSGNVHPWNPLQMSKKHIEKGLIRKWSAIRGKPVLSRRTNLKRQIVDVFEVRKWVGKGCFNAVEQDIFREEFKILVRLLGDGAYKKARERVNRRLISYLAQVSETPSVLQEAVFHPIQVRFNNSASKFWTLLEVRGKNTPIFLYAFSNALAMRDIYFHKVRISNDIDEIRDRFYVTDRRGRKITREEDKKTLRISATLIKQFTHFLVGAPDPAMAIAHFDQFLDKIIDSKQSRPILPFLRRMETMKVLARFFGTSTFLWEDFLRAQFENLRPILEGFRKEDLRIGKKRMEQALGRRLRDANTLEKKKKIVNAYKDQEMFRIDMKHLVESSVDLTPFSRALTDLAEVVIQQAYEICRQDLLGRHGVPLKEDGSPSNFAICGLGKFGGRELGYASDIELLFVYDGPGESDGRDAIDNRIYFEKLVQKMIWLIDAKKEGIFHIDTRLRPYGASGPLAISREKYSAYYSASGEAAPFERQALIKLRAVAGNTRLGTFCESVRDRFVYALRSWDLDTALSLRARQMDELVPKGMINVKYSPGGIVDIEYLAQYLQIRHGFRHPELRTPNTLMSLHQLSLLGVISADTERQLHEDYLFLRKLIDALRIVRGNAKDLLLPEKESEEFTFLGRRMGYGRRDWERGRKRLEAEITRHMAQAHEVFRSLFMASQSTE